MYLFYIAITCKTLRVSVFNKELLLLLLIYYGLLPKILTRHVTMTMPAQGTVCNLNAKPSHGEPVHKI